VIDGQEVDQQSALPVGEAADRAGAIVTEHIRSIIEQAEANAEEIRRDAHQEADAIRQQAAGSASRMLERIRAIEGPLAELVAELEHEVGGGPSELDQQPPELDQQPSEFDHQGP
jgi:cell division septum initiation protein DivIVA